MSRGTLALWSTGFTGECYKLKFPPPNLTLLDYRPEASAPSVNLLETQKPWLHPDTYGIQQNFRVMPGICL